VTGAFTRIFTGYYRSQYLLRRPASSTLVCSQESQNRLQERVESAIQAMPSCFAAPYGGRFSGPIPPGADFCRVQAADARLQALLRFEAQRAHNPTPLSEAFHGLTAQTVENLHRLELRTLTKLAAKRGILLA
jgi:hypothetical protein